VTRLFVEHLTVIDCAFLDAQRGLVGESWIVDLELAGDLDSQGMVLDFGEVKKRLKKAVDAVADHRLLVPRTSPHLDFVKSGADCGLSFKAEPGPIEHQSPLKAVCLVDAETITSGTVGAHVQEALRKSLPENVTEARIGLRNETMAGAYYHYTHGLKKHAGECQRIAHGHRSRLQVSINGKRDERIERQWADRWRDIYLGTAADIVAHGKGRIRFEYQSGEGRFELELPVDRCDLLQTDSTVERIAEHVAACIAGDRPGQRIEVRAYEGVMKGAVATAG
jgi:6-pyruvoyl-tetrahydropterin synthase